MSLQEGIAVLRARMGLQQALSRLALGRRTDVPTEPPPYPATNLRLPASCLRYLTPVFPLPASAHTLPKLSLPRFVPVATCTHYSTFPERGRERGRGEAGMFRRDIRVSEAERGRVPCRSKEHTASTSHTQSNPKQKPLTELVRGWRAADGNRTRVSGLGSVRSTIELQPHLFQCIVPACRG